MRNKNILVLISIFLLSTFLIACGNNAEEPTADKQDNATSSNDGPTNVTVHADTINSHTVEHAVCVVNSRFEQGWGMVFRASVTDDDGNIIEDADVKAVLENGEELEMKIGEHGDKGTLLYTVLWMIPEDFPTGTLEYEIVATVDGVDHVYEPFDVEPSKFTIIEPEES